MENLKALSVKYQLEKSNTIDPSKIRHLRSCLLNEIKTPLFKSISNRLVYTGETLKFRINDYNIPIINLYEGKIDKGPDIGTRELKVSVNGIYGALIVPCKWNKSLREISFVVPERAVHGVIFLLVPAEMYYGPVNDGRIKKFLNSAGCENGTGVKSSKSSKSSIGGYTIVIPEIVLYLRTTCGRCLQPSLSICPKNAILFDEFGYCYVNGAECEGQYKEIDSENNYTEVLCWQCFPPGSTAVSSPYCFYGNLNKVLWIEERCCGCCAIPAQVISGMCLKDFCEYKAIGGGHPDQHTLPDGTPSPCNLCPNQIPLEPGSPQGYTVYPELCTGCMTCYNNIICWRPKMKAYIKGEKYGFKAQNLRLRPILPEMPDLSEFSLALGVWGELGGEQYFKEIKLHFGNNYIAPVQEHFESSKPVQFGIYGINKSGSKVTLSGDIRPAFHSIKTPGNSMVPGKINFSTRLGTLQLDLIPD